MLDQVVSGWKKTDVGGQFWALVELGDLDFLRWLEEIIRAMPDDDQRKGWLKSQAQLVRLQHDPGALLGLLRSDKRGVDGAWLLRQGVRHGVDREALRSAATDRMRAARDDPGARDDASMLKRECEDMELFGEAEMGAFKFIDVPRGISDGPRPGWATLTETKRTEFYRPTKPPDRVEPTVPTDDDK
ncbi:MAG: hypothetical protein V1790_05230 [Planctomycetota bacterium]